VGRNALDVKKLLNCKEKRRLAAPCGLSAFDKHNFSCIKSLMQDCVILAIVKANILVENQLQVFVYKAHMKYVKYADFTLNKRLFSTRFIVTIMFVAYRPTIFASTSQDY